MQTEKAIKRAQSINNLVGVIGDCLCEIKSLYIEVIAENKDDPRSLQVDEAISGLAAISEMKSRLFGLKSVYVFVDKHSPFPTVTQSKMNLKGRKK